MGGRNSVRSDPGATRAPGQGVPGVKSRLQFRLLSPGWLFLPAKLFVSFSQPLLSNRGVGEADGVCYRPIDGGEATPRFFSLLILWFHEVPSLSNTILGILPHTVVVVSIPQPPNPPGQLVFRPFHSVWVVSQSCFEIPVENQRDPPVFRCFQPAGVAGSRRLPPLSPRGVDFAASRPPIPPGWSRRGQTGQ